MERGMGLRHTWEERRQALSKLSSHSGDMDERKAVEVEIEWHGQGSQTMEPAEIYTCLSIFPWRSFLDSWTRSALAAQMSWDIASAPPGYNGFRIVSQNLHV